MKGARERARGGELEEVGGLETGVHSVLVLGRVYVLLFSVLNSLIVCYVIAFVAVVGLEFDMLSLELLG